MLNAILSGKKRGSGLEGEALEGTFEGAEDTLTATVFERLSYLPDHLAIDVLFSSSIWATVTVTLPTTIESVLYWPRWKAVHEMRDVEPDCVFEFNDRTLLVEAKRYDFLDRQDPKQLANEWASATAVFPGKPIWLLAVGGLRDSRPATVAQKREAVRTELQELGLSCETHELQFAAITWSHLYSVIASRLADSQPFRRLVEDLREGMLLHGVAVEPPTWLNELLLPPWQSILSISTSPDAFTTPVSEERNMVDAETKTLHAALAGVRRAYRLLWAYQLRMIDYNRCIRERLGFEHYYVHYITSRPGFKLDRAWDLIPCTALGFLSVRRKPDVALYPRGEWMNYPRAGDVLLEVLIESDSGFYQALATGNTEPNPLDFTEVSESESRLHLRLALNQRDRGELLNWYQGILLPIRQWPTSGKSADHPRIADVKLYSEVFNLEDLGNEEAVLKAVDHLSEAVPFAIE